MKSLESLLRDQIAAQEMPSYVYTYPPKSAYRPYDGSWRDAASAWTGFNGKMAVYVHVPFCEMKCAFCDLFTVTNLHRPPLVERYVRCLLKEMELMRPYLDAGAVTVGSLYFGGGTPTLLSRDHLDSILGKIREIFAIDRDAEISIEGAPNTVDAAKCDEYRRLGFNRLSLGIQTFSDEGLRRMGRSYGAELGREAARAAVRSGIANVNVDLIYGIPGQTLEDWSRNLEEIREIGPQTVTAYPLVVRQRTPLGKAGAGMSRDAVMNERNRYGWYDFTVGTLAAAGYRAETLVTYAREAGGCRHEQNEYDGMPTLAIGAGARKYAPALHYVDDDYADRRPNQATLMAYMDSIESGAIPVRSTAALSKEERQRRFVILGLLSSGLSLERYAELFQEKLAQPYDAYFDVLESEGLLLREGGRVALTPKGKKYSSIIGHLLASDVVQRSRYLYH